jgi:hypothetical protein
METNNTTQPAKGFRVGRLEVGFNIVVQLILVVAGIVMLNWLGNKYYARLDWSRGKNTVLSPQTKALLGGLEKPVQAIVMFASVGEAEADAQTLLREYQFAAKGKLTVEEVDPYANLARAKDLQAQYKFGANENVVIFTYDGRHKFVNSGDLAEFEQMDQMAMMMQQRRPQMIGFKGEQVFTSTLLELTETKQNKVYLVSGHGEYDGKSKEIAAFGEFLTRQNLKSETLKLADKDKVPDDANLLMILGPKFDFSERDLKLLSEFWERNGRIFIGTGWTNGKTPNLNEWLSGRGVRPQNDAVIRVVSLGNLAGLQPLEGIVIQGSPITKGIEGVGTEMFGPTQSLRLDQNLAKAAQLQLAGLLLAPEGFWGETEYSPGDRTTVPMFDPKKDHVGPLMLGVAVERGGSNDPKVKLETSRLVVFGNGDFLTDQGLQVGAASLELALNSMNWLLNRENLISIPPKEKTKQSLKLTDAQVGTIRWWVMVFIPLGIAVFGLYHLMWRSGKNVFVLTLWLAGAFLTAIVLWLALQWQLGLWKPTIRMPLGVWIGIGTALTVGVAAAIGNHLEQKRRATNQE